MRATGDHFVVGERPFRFVGANLTALQGERERARFRETLHALAADGLTVGRVWIVGEGPPDADEWFRRDHLFRAGPDGWIEASYQQLDRVLAEARAQGVRLILTLGNHWSDFGGVPAYLHWAGLPVEGAARDAFYSDERTRAWYRAGLDRLLQRTNSVTGLRYIDDPTIFAWELLNESEVATPDGAEARRRWIVEMARHVKTVDKNHMVAPGLIGYVTRAERAEWVRVHRLAEVDYCDSHLYPQTSDSVPSWQRLADLVDDRAQLARFVIGKPLVIGEFGFHTLPGERRWLGRPRAEWFARFLERVFIDGGGGALAWIYQPWLGKRRDFGIYVDRPDTDDVRARLRGMARRVLEGIVGSNPRLGQGKGDRPLYDPMVSYRGNARVADRWRARDGGERLLEIPVDDFASARFESFGRWDRGVLFHVYGTGAGEVRYRFAIPPALAGRALTLEARLSSEWPGASGPPGGGSLVVVSVDGHERARIHTSTDDGTGRVETIDLGALAAGVHTLVLAVPDDLDAHGLCVYGAPTGNPPVEGAAPVGELGPLRLRARSKP